MLSSDILLAKLSATKRQSKNKRFQLEMSGVALVEAQLSDCESTRARAMLHAQLGYSERGASSTVGTNEVEKKSAAKNDDASTTRKSNTIRKGETLKHKSGHIAMRRRLSRQA